MPQLFVYAVFGIALIAGLTIVVVMINFFGTWLRAKLAGAAVSFTQLIGMRLRRVPIGLIVDNRITAVKAGIDLDTDPLEAHYLAGGNVSHVVLALIAAAKAGKPSSRPSAQASTPRSSIAQIPPAAKSP